jgi:hypothetical protein
MSQLLPVLFEVRFGVGVVNIISGGTGYMCYGESDAIKNKYWQILMILFFIFIWQTVWIHSTILYRILDRY